MLVATIALGASAADSTATARLEVTSDIDSAAVYLDSVYVGQTPLTLEAVPSGIHSIRVVPPRPEYWAVRAVTDTVHLLTGQGLTVSIGSGYSSRSRPIRPGPSSM